MSVRFLLACVVALAAMIACMVAGWLGGPALDGWYTPVGLLAPGELAGAALAGFSGGLIARERFRVAAVGLVLVAGLAGTAAAWLMSDFGAAEATLWLMRHALGPLVLASGLAWLAAMGGEHVARRVAHAR